MRAMEPCAHMALRSSAFTSDRLREPGCGDGISKSTARDSAVRDARRAWFAASWPALVPNTTVSLSALPDSLLAPSIPPAASSATNSQAMLVLHRVAIQAPPIMKWVAGETTNQSLAGSIEWVRSRCASVEDLRSSADWETAEQSMYTPP